MRATPPCMPADYEGRPERRPLTRAELQAFFDAADEHVERAAGSRRKGWLAAFRDATAVQGDLRVGAAAPGGGDAGCGRLRGRTRRLLSWAGLGVCHVRYGKAMRGSPPRRRAVASVMPWAAEALAQYLEEVRPRFGRGAIRRCG